MMCPTPSLRPDPHMRSWRARRPWPCSFRCRDLACGRVISWLSVFATCHIIRLVTVSRRVSAIDYTDRTFAYVATETAITRAKAHNGRCMRPNSHRSRPPPAGCPYLDGLVVGLFVPLPGVAELPVPGIPPAAPVPLAAPPAPVPAPPAPPAWAHEPETVPKRSAKLSATTPNFCILSTPIKIGHWFNQWHKHSFLL
jgi:hypothetical protein